MRSVAQQLNTTGWKILVHFTIAPGVTRSVWGTTDPNTTPDQRTLHFDTEALMCVSATQPQAQRTTVVRLRDVRGIARRLRKQLDDFDTVDVVESNERGKP